MSTSPSVNRFVTTVDAISKSQKITHGARAILRRSKRELDGVARSLGSRRRLTQISLGGGTPTFFTADELVELYRAFEQNFDIASHSDISIEVDPRVTSDEQLVRLRELGFNRISLGVQDFDPKVQEAVNRVQSSEMVAKMLARCRELKYDAINFDFIYGLPHQTFDSFQHTVEEIVRLRPDRIALYNYARLPSLLKHQVVLEQFPMPSAEERVDIFTMAYDTLLGAGYGAIGMDHFALATDELFKALDEGTLYRNFMGYVVKKGTDLLGVGTSAIGEFRDAYFQNLKGAKDYEVGIASYGLATGRGCLLSKDDLRRKWVIQRLMCGLKLEFGEFETQFHASFEEYFATELPLLEGFYLDGILTKGTHSIHVTSLGRLFIRNVAMVFDAYLATKKTTFSQTV